MDKYEKVRVVGRGAYGVCWLCKRKDHPLAQKVILKTINLHGMSKGEEEAVLSEVNLLKKVQHPMIIGYYEFFTFENQLTIVMQYAEGGTMEKMIIEQNGIHFQESLVLNYFTQILIALNHLHSKQVVHRDLKTQNILLNRKKTLIKLSDFGISKELSTRSVASTVIGTPNYLSPEICEGRDYNQKSDIWSLGCVLYELLVLKRTFDGENLPSIVMKITKCCYSPIGDHASAEAKHLVDSLLQLNEKKRPDVKDLLTWPVILPITLSIHLDLGRLQVPQPDKRKVSVASRLRTTPVSQTMKAGEKSKGLVQLGLTTAIASATGGAKALASASDLIPHKLPAGFITQATTPMHLLHNK